MHNGAKRKRPLNTFAFQPSTSSLTIIVIVADVPVTF